MRPGELYRNVYDEDVIMIISTRVEGSGFEDVVRVARALVLVEDHLRVWRPGMIVSPNGWHLQFYRRVGDPL